MRSPLLRLALCCSLSLALGAPSLVARAQDKSGEKDLAELQHYTLTMDKANRYGEVFEDLKALSKAHPELKNAFAGDGTDSLDAMEQRIQSQPPVVAVLTKHSFTPREFVVFGLALFQSAFAQATAEQNGVDPAKAAAEAHVNPANINFVGEHKAEIEALMVKIKKSAEADSSSN